MIQEIFEYRVFLLLSPLKLEKVFCLYEVKPTSLLFHKGTFLELLEPYILKDMLGALAPEVSKQSLSNLSKYVTFSCFYNCAHSTGHASSC